MPPIKLSRIWDENVATSLLASIDNSRSKANAVDRVRRIGLICTLVMCNGLAVDWAARGETGGEAHIGLLTTEPESRVSGCLVEGFTEGGSAATSFLAKGASEGESIMTVEGCLAATSFAAKGASEGGCYARCTLVGQTKRTLSQGRYSRRETTSSMINNKGKILLAKAKRSRDKSRLLLDSREC